MRLSAPVGMLVTGIPSRLGNEEWEHASKLRGG